MSVLARYVLAVSVAGVAATAALVAIAAAEPRVSGMHTVALATCIVVSECFPLRLSRAGGEITTSTSFTFALLWTDGPVLAVAAAVLASIIADALQRKPADRITFNAAQYALAWSATGMGVLVTPELGGHDGAFGFAAHLPDVVVAGTVFFLLNFAVATTAPALAARIRVRDALREGIAFEAGTAAILIGFSPVIATVATAELDLIPLLALPLLAIYLNGRQSLRNEHQALHDALTGLPNRSLLHSELAEKLVAARRDDAPLAVLVMDLDGFKDVNDTLGHAYGDELLRQLSARLTPRLASYGMLARLGGDEFALVAPGVDADRLEPLLASITAEIRRPFSLGGLSLELGTSTGIARFPHDGGDVETLLKRADIAMYRAKRRRTGHALYEPSMDAVSPARLVLAGELRRAIEDGALRLQYQPKLTLATGAVEAVEALVRWHHPTRGVVPPGEFVELAEHTGLIAPLTDWVLDTAVGQAAEWRAAGRQLAVAVNVSARSLLDERLATKTAAALQRHGLAPGLLQLEITETAIMSDTAVAVRLLDELRSMGVSLAIDDYGTGYSSLAYLQRMPVQTLKIDRSLVSNIVGEGTSRAIVGSTIALGTSLGLQVVGEGVEDDATLAELRRLGCHQVQGYHVCRPVDPEDLLRWLERRDEDMTPAAMGTLTVAQGR